MKLNYWLIVAVTAVVLLLSVPGITQIPFERISSSSESSSIETLIAQSNSAREDNSDILYFGSLRDVYPFSPEEDYGYVNNYCGKLKDYLVKSKFKLDPVKIKVTERFQGFGVGKNLAVECAPNTINQDRIDKIKKKGGTFSEPFLTTGTKLLIKQEKLDSFYQEIPLKEETIGVLKETTTKDVLLNRPLAKVFF